MLAKADRILTSIQSFLDFNDFTSPQFRHSKGLGRVGVGGMCVGVVWGGCVVTIILSLLIIYTTPQPYTLLYTLVHWNTYLLFLCTFHCLEFITTALYQPDKVSYDSFVINHSKTYTAAALISMVEFWVEEIIFYGSNKRMWIILMGLLLVVSGQIVRTVAMSTCGENFSHIIMRDRDGDSHHLVTTGIYTYLRHPSYTGWFYWSIGTQLLLCNPVSFILYTYASWRFFRDRIPYEEEVLIQCYGSEYISYIKKTVIGIPMVFGADISHWEKGTGDKTKKNM